QRFHLTFQTYLLDNKSLALEFNNRYVEECSQKPNLLPNAYNVLSDLSKKYSLHIITNGFKEVQMLKLNNSGISQFFKEVIISENFGVNKPDPRIFKHALERGGATANKSIMVGDDFEADIVGAQK